jgi:DNA repair exonuclease SbcCD ATPase subunit
MAQKTLKEYGLEFINEMAKDREVAQQEIGVGISGAKSSLVNQGLQHFTYKDMEEFVKIIRKETARIVDGELTRITLKSLGRIRQVIKSDATFLQEVTSTVSEEHIQEYEKEIQNFKEQIKEKNTQLSQLEHEREENRREFEENKDKVDQQEIEIKRLQNQVQNFQEQDELSQKRVIEIRSELAAKEALIEKLKENEKIHEKDIEEALASIAETYQIQEDYYARMLEEAVQQRLKQVRQDYDLEIEEMQTRLKNEIQRHEADSKQHKITVSRLEEALAMAEQEQHTLQEKLAQVYDERSQRNLILEYTQRLLSTHPLYASILILLNLGGSLDLPTLAMSVGAHPTRLKQMLQEELVSRNLITLSNDDPPIVHANIE